MFPFHDFHLPLFPNIFFLETLFFLQAQHVRPHSFVLPWFFFKKAGRGRAGSAL